MTERIRLRTQPAGGLLTYAIPEAFAGASGMLDVGDLEQAGFVHEGRPRDEDLNLELVLSQEEAAQGGAIAFTVPIRRRCPRCGGAGGSMLSACEACGGEGELVHEHPIEAVFTPGVRDGQMAALPLDALGVPGASVRVHVTVR